MVVGPGGHWSWHGYFANGAQEGGQAVHVSEGMGMSYLISRGGDYKNLDRDPQQCGNKQAEGNRKV